MKTCLSKFLAVSVGLGLWTATSRAQELIHVVISLNIAVQADSVDDGTTTKTPPPLKFHAGVKELLTRLETDHATNYPAGARVALTNEQFAVVDKTGNILDMVPELSLSISDNEKIKSGSQNDTTGAGSSTSVTIATLTFDESNDSAQTNQAVFSISGVFTTRKTVSKPGTGNAQLEADSGSGNLAGAGTVSGRNAIVTGTISGTGKGPFSP